MKLRQATKHKFVDLEEAIKRMEQWQSIGDTVVFTNGCYDLLHLGHITYLEAASSMGERLIVAVNSDASVRRLEKGEDRPINSEVARATLLAALAFVDLVIVFDNDTPYEVIRTLQPNVLVKGADYDPEERDSKSKKYIVGSDIIRENGGIVRVVQLVEGYSTTSIANQLKKQN
jgi:rfaE bifunctional protein nucleotidyltransferase chain/domain